MSLCPVDHKQCQCSATSDDPCRAVEALRKDAERYRWIKLMRPGALLAVAWGESKAACSIGDDPDAAIDAAMAKEPT